MLAFFVLSGPAGIGEWPVNEFFNSTDELAKCLKVQPNTIRRGLCVTGNYLGLVPVKLPNGRLLWPKSKLDQLLFSQQTTERS
jgi:hypothetical protein